jgi:predicted CXXCH cytochrome family protein
MGHLDPSRKGQELGCTSCHNPHSSEKKVLLVNDGPDSPANLCHQCHTKITVRP